VSEVVEPEPPAPRAGPQTLECRRLLAAYADLRVADPSADGRLAASLAEHGQKSPVLVVGRGAGWVLIDGYRRVRLLTKLGIDTVECLELALGEAEALAHCHRLETGRRRSSLEDGWLVRELMANTGWTLDAIGLLLGRSKSWVSRRLGLARGLPERIERAVRTGQVPPHAAMKSFLPLARANPAHAERIVSGLGAARLTTREAAALYAAWRAGDAAQKERIAEAPLLFLRATAQPAAPKLPEGEAGRLVRNLDIAAGALWRAREDLQRAVVADPTTPSQTRVRRAHRLTTAAYEALRGKWEEHDAGSGHASGHLPIAR
jgi:ParB family chromosome partitioning protein